VKVLLDTHTLLWAVVNPAPLSSAALKIVAAKTSVILVSAASAWEIATKVRKGKLPGAETFEHDFLHTLDVLGYALLSIDAETALRAARLPGDHRDPFDRIIAAHALALDIPVISLDAKLDQFGVRRIW
jgi:PIN domain nuclease of toxin-antitoxin system